MEEARETCYSVLASSALLEDLTQNTLCLSMPCHLPHQTLSSCSAAQHLPIAVAAYCALASVAAVTSVGLDQGTATVTRHATSRAAFFPDPDCFIKCRTWKELFVIRSSDVVFSGGKIAIFLLPKEQECCGRTDGRLASPRHASSLMQLQRPSPSAFSMHYAIDEHLGIMQIGRKSLVHRLSCCSTVYLDSSLGGSK
jgi:hypothetical protein